MAVACGFGSDATSNEYKVVKLFERFPDSPLELECEVLVLGTTMSWKRIQCQDGLRLKCPHFNPDSVFVEGSIYWCNGTHILCFDVAAERFKLIPTPDMKPLRLKFPTGCCADFLVELDSSLCYMEHVSGGGVGIWKMQKDKENPWIRQYIIDVGCINIPEVDIKSVCIQNKKTYLKYGKGMDFGHLPFYNRDLTVEDILRQPQRVPLRSLYKFAFGAETRLEQALTLIDKISLEELIEVITFARMRRNLISSGRELHGETEGM
ncbi:uncharacterized protein LOC113279839 [Papaver somniferum]|uniref:uncharacterized protein LOC113279839 n=1 Tax=Papaver somniferum TaxID=3469 RepID=UPI000E6FA615|nr:uncharacterized protein LOC113279839 [Papaver somniferum]